MDTLNLLLYATLATITALGIVFLSAILGPRKSKPTMLGPYECGKDPVGTTRERFSIKFYMVAILFIVFDIEIVFLIPWAVVYRSLSWVGFIEMMSFIAVLGFGLLYIWKRGALEWK